MAVTRLDAVLETISHAEWRNFVAADRTRWAILVGERPAERPPDDGAGDDIARLNVTMTDALVAVMAGRLAAAARHIEAGLPLAERLRAEVPNGADLLRLTDWIRLLFAGQLDRSRALAATALDAAGPDAEAAGVWQYAISLIDLHAGRPAAAAERSTDAIRLLEWRDFTGLVATAHAVRATALAQLGRIGESRVVLDRLDGFDELDIWAALQRAQAVAWVAAAEQRHPDLSEVVAVSRRGVAAGQVCLAAITSHVAVRLGHAELVADDLHEAALRCEGTLLPVLSAHAAAAIARRPADLLDAAEQLAVLGLNGAAADAATHAARLLDADGRREAARHASQQAARWMRPSGSAHELTLRELDVARRAAERWSSRAIAEQLDVSPRTVDNHLSRVYRKLGIAGRPELAPALQALGLID
ncbi:MAG TPA: helix-turn-helix transcriptional regulator [Ilumatobacter sp.]|nr:helix-turn-helix transcriptional regulator [Ilumatobacter sp.]